MVTASRQRYSQCGDGPTFDKANEICAPSRSRHLNALSHLWQASLAHVQFLLQPPVTLISTAESCVIHQDDTTHDLAPLLTALAGGTALRRLCISGHTSADTFGYCGLLRELTALEVGTLTEGGYDEQLNDALWGLTRLQRLRVQIDLGTIAVAPVML